MPWLLDRKWCYIRMEGTTFGDVPLNAELKLEVWDSPNSAGVITDAIRCLKLGLDRGLTGTLVAPSSYFMKSPPQQIHDDIAFNRVEAFIRGEDNETLVGTEAPVKKHASSELARHRRPRWPPPPTVTVAANAGSRRRTDAARRRPADRRAHRRSLAYRADGVAAAHACRPVRPRPCSGSSPRRPTSPGRQAALVERELRARPRACRPTILASAGWPARLPRYGRYLVELMRLPACRPTRSARSSGPRCQRQIARIWRRRRAAAG